MIKGEMLPCVARILEKNGRVSVGCVGDSITEGFKSSDPSRRSYPAVLADLLGDRFTVKNYGVGGSTLLRAGDLPYTQKPEYTLSLTEGCRIILIMLGTNDCNRDFNIRRLAGFSSDLVSLVNDYRNAGAEPVILTSPELFLTPNNAYLRRAAQIQRETAALTGCPLIDVNEFSHGRLDLFPDGIHCDDSGYAALAGYIANRAFGKDLFRVTVSTRPGAFVIAGSSRGRADGDGAARFFLPEGEYLIRSFMPGGAEDTVRADVTCDCSFSLFPAEAGRELAVVSASASSFEPDNPPENAVDGRGKETRWASAARDGEWLTADLGSVRPVTGVLLVWEAAYASAFEIQLSENGTDFVTAAGLYDGAGDINALPLPAGSRARYVRMLGISRGTFYGFSLYEFKIFGE